MATKRWEVYKCEVCGIVAEILDGGTGELICCGQPMTLLEEQTADPATEKHVPVIEQTNEGVTVKVGSVPHPMEDKHFIQMIEIIADDCVCREYLKAGDAPQAIFNFKVSPKNLIAREICNLHGLWKGH